MGDSHGHNVLAKKHHLRVYNIYRPCQQTDNSDGDQTVWQQHRRVLRQDNIDLDPRKQLLNSLALHIREDVAKKRQVFIMGDFNENIFDPELNSFFSKSGLFNVAEQYLDPTIRARSYFRGSKIIDGVWCTRIALDSIRSFGIAPFYFVVPSDHRAIYCDIDTTYILDDTSNMIQPAPYRRLISTAPRRVKSYCESVESNWFLHNINLKVDQLEDKFQQEGPTHKIDSQINEILTNSEKKCCKVGRQDNNQYSNALGKSIRSERHIRCALGREAMSLNFQFRNHKIKNLLKDLRQSRRDKREAKANEVDFRNNHLDERAEQFVRDHPGAKKSNVITQLKHIEKQIRESSRIDYALNGRQSGALSYLLISAQSSYPAVVRDAPTFDHTNIKTIYDRVSTVHNGKDVSEWEVVNDKNQVERLTLECMQMHFSKADGTPLTSPDWISRMNDETVQNSILDGTFDCNPYPRALRLYLKALEQPNRPKQLHLSYSFDEFQFFIKSAKEKTSSSPSGRHYGHYIVLNQHLKDILHDIYRIMMIGLNFGVVLDRYKNTVTTLIPKDDGLPKIHRLHPIHIIESELQAITKS